jgi:hypothetical protein
VKVFYNTRECELSCTMRNFFKQKKNKDDNKHVPIPESHINEDLKVEITNLEKLADKHALTLQEEYKDAFALNNKQNLKIWVCRDIDGDELAYLSYNNSLEKEYRSRVVIDYDGAKYDEEFYAYDMYLWYYYTGYFKGSGTLYNYKEYDLHKEIESALKELLTF